MLKMATILGNRKLSHQKGFQMSVEDAVQSLTAKNKIPYYKHMKYGALAVLVLSIIGIWTIFSLPLLIGYFLTPPRNVNLSYDYVHELNNTKISRILAANISLSCPSLYRFNGRSCVPECGNWHPFGLAYFLVCRSLSAVFSFVSILVALIGCTTLLLFWNKMKVHHIIYLYLFSIALLFNIGLAVGAFPGPALFFCDSSADYRIVSDKPPLRVTILGAIMHYLFIAFNFWFVTSVFNIFLGVYFATYRLFKYKTSRWTIFTIENVVNWCVPLLVPILMLAVFNYYTFLRLPQLPRPPDDIATLLTITLPLVASSIATLTIISLLLYKIQTQRFSVRKDNEIIKLKSFEIRMIIFAILTSISVSIITIDLSIQLVNKPITDKLFKNYWSCLTLRSLQEQFNMTSFQNETIKCNREYDPFVFPVLTILADFCLGGWSVLLIVIITTKEFCSQWTRLFSKYRGTAPIRASTPTFRHFTASMDISLN